MLRSDEYLHHLIRDISDAELLRNFMMSPGMGGGSGPISLYGPDMSEWPSYVVDAMLVYVLERAQVDSKMRDVDHPPQ